MGILYFDHAATSFPKPRSVVGAVHRSFDECGGNPGRSGHKLSVSAARAVFDCREELCALFSINTPERICFAGNATYALNMAINGLYEKNSHIVVSNLEHNSVLRPVHHLCECEENQCSYSVFDALGSDEEVCRSFLSSLRKDTRLAVITAASNVCGKILPLKELSALCRERNIRLIVDASQASGEIPLDLRAIAPDALCSAGHKGLLGPMGTGFAVFGEKVTPRPFAFGGNGVRSFEQTMGDTLPESLEAGTLNTPGIIGLCEGVKYVRKAGIYGIRQKTGELERKVTEGLQNAGAEVYGIFQNKTPVVLFNVPGKSAMEVSSFLDSQGVCTRSGLHCAPLAHAALGTAKDGAVRVSLGYSNTQKEAYRFLCLMDRYVRCGG